MINVTLPVAIELVVDDVGWHNGADERYKNLPARSGLPRFHHPDDIKALNAIGEGLNMKIVCSLVLGEWDRKNILRGVPHVTNNENGWDAAGEMDPDYTKAYFEALEDSEYLDYALHGLTHGYYENDVLNTTRQYYPAILDERRNKVGFTWLSPNEFSNMLKLFMDIYNEWGFKKKIDTFVSPCGCMGSPNDEGNLAYSRVLKDMGIKYWSNSWETCDSPVSVLNGLISTVGYGIVTWNAYDVDPDYLPVVGEGEAEGIICGMHLTNFIRFNHEKNPEYVPKWINYFKRQAEVFGFMLARDIADSSSQAMYNRFAELCETENSFTVDLSEVDRQGALAVCNEFYVSIRDGREPISCTGGEISLYESKGSFKTYKIKRTSDKIKVALA